MRNSWLRLRVAAAVTALSLGAVGLTALAAPVAQAAGTDTGAAGEQVAKLPISSFGALVVDSAHQRVYVSDDRRSSGAGSVHVFDFDGARVATLATDDAPSSLALSPDGATLEVAQTSGVISFDTATYARTARYYGNYDVYCPRDAGFAGGRVWYTETSGDSDCDNRTYTLFGTADGRTTATGWNATGRLRLFGSPQNPDRLIMAQPRGTTVTDPFLTVFDASGTTLVRNAERRFADSAGQGGLDMRDVAQSPDGKRIAVADAIAGTRLLDADDLSDAATAYQPLPAGAVAAAVAFSGDGKYIARGAAATGSTADLLVQAADPADTTPPLEFAFEGALDGNKVQPRGLAWSEDGSRLFAVTNGGNGYEYWLHIIQPPAAQYDTRFAGGLSTSAAQPVVGEPLGIRGRLEIDGPAPAQPVKVTAVRHDAGGDRTLAAAEVDADGTFTVLDVPSVVGPATYTVSFTGDLTHRPTEDVSLETEVAKAPTAIALTAPAEGTKGVGLRITGTLTGQGRALPAGITLSVVRTDKRGTGTLTSAAVAANGTFTVDDIPGANGEVTYEVGYAGDDLHLASMATATVRVRKPV
ncbi:Ig-like domain repeat protein [Streptomyces sp. NBC_00102]|uniref:Ig-like domain repeat protein n=1 Tax=Streptomyces sp. NBC_00102 TaxID=2975652 RepID=UPI00224D6BE6|nr:Ig-like domain repeat protein [Streptomyces sp. NBC_00102]MCX5399382.1 Ig-like domain repeat protein [Streptomyces sp. NBC_00102]